MKRSKSAAVKTNLWRRYCDLVEVTSISVAQGVALLIEYWPQERRIDRTAIRKRIRTRVEQGVARGQLVVQGSGMSGRVSPVEFFRWAVGWADMRARVGDERVDDMSMAALRFGAPNAASIDGNLGALSGEFRGLDLPSSGEEASAIALEYQRLYLDAVKENQQLREKLAMLESEVEDYRRVKAAWARKKAKE